MEQEKGQMWMYLDDQQQRKGPLNEELLKRLIKRDIVKPKTYVWANGMKEWHPVQDTNAFRSYVETLQKSWYYLKKDGQQSEPVSTKELIRLFMEGDLDGCSMIWGEGCPNWLPLVEMKELKVLLQEENSDKEREEEALKTQEKIADANKIYEAEKNSAQVKIVTAEDGKQYVYDTESRQWLTPDQRIEDELQALVDLHDTKNPEQANDESGDVKKPKKKKKKRKKASDKWVDTKQNTWVYVTGLHNDTTEEELAQVFAKCGVIQTDLRTGKPRIKLYRNKDTGILNGDASVCYLKPASIELAIQLLDASEIHHGCKIKVSEAIFSQKGSTFVKQKRAKIDQKAKIRQIEQQHALSWNEGIDNSSGMRIVVLKHMFVPSDFDDATFLDDLERDVGEECTKLGPIEKITVFQKHTEGVVVVKFATSGGAALCIERMNGRFFGGRKISCSLWDGTDYTYRESEKELEDRTESFGDWLNEGSSSDDDDEEHIPEAHAGRELPDLDD